ncbi:MAG: T9SS type A sorting domain-containing protein [Gelidibacter sp.]
MKNLCYLKNAKIILLIILPSALHFDVFSQNYITWNNAGGIINGLDGTGISVTATLSPGVPNVAFNFPALVDNNLVVNGANTFSTYGPTNNPPSRDLIFTFNQPVIVTQYNMADMDIGGWNDSFNFNIAFATTNSTNCISTPTGVIATVNAGNNAEFASWFCSNPITAFSLNYIGNNNNLTHAYLAYSMQVMAAPMIDSICLNSVPPNFPQVGNNIQGTWNPATINTSTLGTTQYIFTPNAGQPIVCSIPMDITIIDCCIPTLTSGTNIASMVQEEREDWIRSSDVITFGDGVMGNGVVYHAGNFVELTEGFEAVNGSQFVAYPQGCSGNYQYRQVAEDIIPVKPIYQINNSLEKSMPKVFNIAYSKYNGSVEVTMLNIEALGLKVFSVDGRLVYENNNQVTDSYNFNISSLNSGVYIINVIDEGGNVHSEKFIKR